MIPPLENMRGRRCGELAIWAEDGELVKVGEEKGDEGDVK